MVLRGRGCPSVRISCTIGPNAASKNTLMPPIEAVTRMEKERKRKTSQDARPEGGQGKKEGPGRDLNPGPLANHFELTRDEKRPKRESYH